MPEIAPLRSYRHSDHVTVERFVTSLMGWIPLSQEPPRTWNSSSAISDVDLRHQGMPLVSGVVAIDSPPEHALKAALSMVASIAAPEFFVSLPFTDEEEQVMVLLPDVKAALPTLVALILLSNASFVPVGYVSSGLLVAHAVDGTAAIAVASTAAMSALFMECLPS